MVSEPCAVLLASCVSLLVCPRDSKALRSWTITTASLPHLWTYSPQYLLFKLNIKGGKHSRAHKKKKKKRMILPSLFLATSEQARTFEW